MNIDAVIQDIVSKILYKNRKTKKEGVHRIYNKNVENFLNRSCDADNFNFGKAWIVEKPNNTDVDIKAWVDMIEAEMQFNLSRGLTN